MKVYAGLLMFVLSLLLQGIGAAKTPRGRNERTKRPATSPQKSQAGRCKNKTTFVIPATELQNHPFSFKCPAGPVFEASVTGVGGACRGYTPLLLAEAGRCRWNSTCTLTYRGHPIMRTEEGDRYGACVGKTPDSFEVRYSCLKNKTVVHDVLKQMSTTDKESGLVKSHSLYPWSYRDGTKFGILRFNRPRKGGLKNLWFTVQDFGILHSDFVVLRYTNSSKHNVTKFIEHNDTTLALKDVSTVEMIFYANYTLHHSKLKGEEKGFVFCFQWLKGAATPKDTSVCSGIVQPRKCEENAGRRPSDRRRGTRRPRH